MSRRRLVSRAAPICVVLVLTGCGGSGGAGGSGSGSSPITNANSPPLAVAKVSASAGYSSQTLTLDGRDSRDSDGNITAFGWAQTSGPAVVLNSASSSQAFFVAPPVAAAQEVRLRLEVTDDDGARSSADVSITIVPADVQLGAEVAQGAAFRVDDEAIRLTVSGASFAGEQIQPAKLSWRSSMQGEVVESAAIGKPVDVSLQAATHTLTLVADCGALGTVQRIFKLPVLPRMLPVTPFEQVPAAGHKAVMPVVAVTIVPTVDGEFVDLSQIPEAGGRPQEWLSGKVQDVLDYTSKLSARLKYMLEERSRFRGYKDAAAQPYLGYQVVAHYVLYESIPVTNSRLPPDPAKPYVDLFNIMERISGQSRVEQDGVKEIWLWAYTGEKVSGLWESNMSSPTTGDISNSDPFGGDLPIYSRTYYVYGYNYQRSQAEALPNHGHQLERQRSYVDQRRSGNGGLFWGDFVGMSDRNWPSGQPMNLGRCGWTHSPPNTNGNYDYLNQTLIDSDCEDWRPDGSGARRPVNSAYFGSLVYNWPDNSSIPQKAETQFYLWWMQNMPGDGNAIAYGASTMENWWRFVADWDGAISGGLGLYR